MAFILHQASLAGLPDSVKTPVLIDLKVDSRNLTGVATAQVVTDMFRVESIHRQGAEKRVLGHGDEFPALPLANPLLYANNFCSLKMERYSVISRPS